MEKGNFNSIVRIVDITVINFVKYLLSELHLFVAHQKLQHTQNAHAQFLKMQIQNLDEHDAITIFQLAKSFINKSIQSHEFSG